MGQQHHKAEPHARDGRVADGMSEALDYLIRVALSAGLNGVARKLSDANADLLPFTVEGAGSAKSFKTPGARSDNLQGR